MNRTKHRTPVCTLLTILLLSLLAAGRRQNISVDLGAGQHAHALEPQDHEAVAHSDDEDGHDEGKDEDTDPQQGVPVPGGVRENQLAVNNPGRCAETNKS